MPSAGYVGATDAVAPAFGANTEEIPKEVQVKTIKDALPVLESVVQMVALHFGKSCEVVLHDLTNTYQSTIVAIENGHVTGRKVGDPGSNLGLEVLRGLSNESGDRFNYVTHTDKGLTLRSSSIYFRDDEGKVIGALCINSDITNLLLMNKELKEFIGIEPQDNGDKVEEFFVSDVGDLVDNMLRNALAAAGKPQEYLTREDMMDVIEYLDRKGFFLITKSGDRICEVLKISKYTLYKYLEKARKNYDTKTAKSEDK